MLNSVSKSKNKFSTYEVLKKRQSTLSYFFSLGLSGLCLDSGPQESWTH